MCGITGVVFKGNSSNLQDINYECQNEGKFEL